MNRELGMHEVTKYVCFSMHFHIACLWEGLQDLPQPLNNFRGLRVTTSGGPTLNEAEFNCWLATQDYLHLMRRKELHLVMGDKQTEAPLQTIQLLLDTACHSGKRREQVTVYCYTSVEAAQALVLHGVQPSSIYSYTHLLSDEVVSSVVPDSSKHNNSPFFILTKSTT